MAREFRTSPDFKTAVLANGAAGTSGQVFTSAGAGAAPSWTTVSGGGGGGLTKFTEAESTTAPNATVYVDSLKAAGTSTDADVALVAKGAGATLAQVPDGTTTGGNKRGTGATDWQKTRSDITFVASGVDSVIGGGRSNKSSGLLSTVTGGNFNKAEGSESSICGGFGNKTTATWASVGGGDENTASGQQSCISGGAFNAASAISAVVGGGYSNAVSASASGIFSGSGNLINSPYGVISGGTNNRVINSAANSFVGGGDQNKVDGITYGTVCGGYINTVMGQYGFIGGGQSNTAYAIGAVVAGGSTNNVSGLYGAILGGSYGTTRGIIGFHVFPACNAPISTTQGCTQAGLLVLGRQTTNNTPTVLSSNSNIAAGANQLLLENNSACSFTGEVIATVGLAGATARWVISGAAKKEYTAASAALVGTPTVTMTHNDAGAAGWVVAVTVDTSRGCLSVTVTGATATTIRWVCKIETTEVTF